MIRCISLLAMVMSLLPSLADSAQIAVTDNLVVDINLEEGWTLHLEPPDALVKEMASHVAHEAAAANASAQQVESVTRKRLAANEAFLYHAASGAHLDIDFSPLDPGARPPSLQTLKNSAEFAAQSLEGEEDVTGMVGQVTATTLNGIGEVALLSAEYQLHGRPTIFRGYIGYLEKYWFFLYFTAPGDNPETLQEMLSMLDLMTIRPVSR